MKVPFCDLNPLHSSLKNELHEALDDCLTRSQWVLGAEVEKFEDHFAKYLGVKEVIGVASGLDALTLILEAEGIGRGDE
ncbi:MAG: Glutamine--scyllo-inositol transaminase, partial [Bacteriovoracaceae bacterium]|nr:Glutamine--scyllo-inositol transaminase [Bacteriovoracaceae bacterium]